MPEEHAIRASRRTRALLVWSALVVELAAGVWAFLAVRAGEAPALPPVARSRIAYGWVILTIVAAVGAYAAGGRRGPGEEEPSDRRALVADGLAGVAALAGMGAFVYVRVWPMLAVAAVVALLGAALALPRRGRVRPVAEAMAAPSDGSR